MEKRFDVFCYYSVWRCFLAEFFYFIEEFFDSLDSSSTSGYFIFKWSHKHLICSECICSVLCDDIIWIDNVSSPFGHLTSVFSEHESDTIEFLEWFAGADNADVVQEFVPETSIDKVSGRVFHPSDVDINLSSILFFGWIDEVFRVFWIHITKSVS